MHTTEEGVCAGIGPLTHGSLLYTEVMKSEALRHALDRHRFDAAFGEAWQEKSRAKEHVFSVHGAVHRWVPKSQPPELWDRYSGRLITAKLCAAFRYRLAEYARAAPGRTFRVSFGQRLNHHALAHAALVVGNSSSGLYEPPSFKILTVNVGDRQAGRGRAASVIDCPAERGAIAAAIDCARTVDCRDVIDPYGDGQASERIFRVSRTIADPRCLLKKSFRDVHVR